MEFSCQVFEILECIYFITFRSARTAFIITINGILKIIVYPYKVHFSMQNNRLLYVSQAASLDIIGKMSTCTFADHLQTVTVKGMRYIYH